MACCATVQIASKEKILAEFPTHGAGAGGVSIGGFARLGWYQ
jgi:hypothetical protein